jgi:hypothetical protein
MRDYCLIVQVGQYYSGHMHMHRRFRHFLLFMITLALMAAPLRGVLALPLPVAADAVDHCAHMQDGAMGMEHMAGMQHTTHGKTGHGCDHGCKGNCCEGKCGNCVTALLALVGSMTMASGLYQSTVAMPVPHHFTGHSLHPPFRPPIIPS